MSDSAVHMLCFPNIEVETLKCFSWFIFLNSVSMRMQEEGEQNLKVTNNSSAPKTVSGKHFQFEEYCFSWLLVGYFCNNYNDSS